MSSTNGTTRRKRMHCSWLLSCWLLSCWLLLLVVLVRGAAQLMCARRHQGLQGQLSATRQLLGQQAQAREGLQGAGAIRGGCEAAEVDNVCAAAKLRRHLDAPHRAAAWGRAWSCWRLMPLLRRRQPAAGSLLLVVEMAHLCLQCRSSVLLLEVHVLGRQQAAWHPSRPGTRSCGAEAAGMCSTCSSCCRVRQSGGSKHCYGVGVVVPHVARGVACLCWLSNMR